MRLNNYAIKRASLIGKLQSSTLLIHVCLTIDAIQDPEQRMTQGDSCVIWKQTTLSFHHPYRFLPSENLENS